MATAEPTTVHERPLVLIQDLIDALPDDVAQSVVLAVLRVARPIIDLVTACESPIEILMALALCGSLERRFSRAVAGRFWVVDPQYSMRLGSQVHGFKWDGHDYRADFCCTAHAGDKHASVLVECDGHEFHERTPGQVRRDNERQRALQLAGFEVLRFSGSEIMASRGVLCAEQVGEFLARRLEAAN